MRIFPLLILALLLTIQSAFGVALTFGTINGGQSSDPTNNNTVLQMSPSVTGQVYNTLGVLWANTRLTKDVCWHCGVTPRGNGQAGFPNDDPNNYFMSIFEDYVAPDYFPAGTYALFVNPADNGELFFASQVKFVVLGKLDPGIAFMGGVMILARDKYNNIVDSYYVPPVDSGAATRPDFNITLGDGISRNIAYVEFSQNWNYFPQGDLGALAYTALSSDGVNRYLTSILIDNFQADPMAGVPEPSTFAFGGLALLGLGAAKFRRRRQS